MNPTNNYSYLDFWKHSGLNFDQEITNEELLNFFSVSDEPDNAPISELTIPPPPSFNPLNIFEYKDPQLFFENIKNLIETGQINADFGCGNSTLLVHAVKIDSEQAVSYLLEKGVDPDQSAGAPKPLPLALEKLLDQNEPKYSTINIVNLLLIKGATLYIQDKNGDLQLVPEIFNIFPYKDKAVSPRGRGLFFLARELSKQGIAIIESPAFKTPIAIKTDDKTFKNIKALHVDSKLSLGSMKFSVDNYNFVFLPWEMHGGRAIGLTMFDPDQLLNLIDDYKSKKSYQRIIEKEFYFVEKVVDTGLKCLAAGIQWVQKRNIPIGEHTLQKWAQAIRELEELKETLPYLQEGFYTPLTMTIRKESTSFDSITPYYILGLEPVTQIHCSLIKWKNFATVFSLSKIFIRREGTDREWQLFNTALSEWCEDKENLSAAIIPFALKSQRIKEKLIEKGLGYNAAQALLKKYPYSKKDFSWKISLKQYIFDFEKFHNKNFSLLKVCLNAQNDEALLQKLAVCKSSVLTLFSYQDQCDILSRALVKGFYCSALEILSRIPEEALSHKSPITFLRPVPLFYQGFTEKHPEAIAVCKTLIEKNVPKLRWHKEGLDVRLDIQNGIFEEKCADESLPDEYHYLPFPYHPIGISCFENRQNGRWKLVVRSLTWTKPCILEVDENRKKTFFEFLDSIRKDKYIHENNFINAPDSCLLTIEGICENKNIHFIDFFALVQLKFKKKVALTKEQHQSWLALLTKINQSDLYSNNSRHYFKQLQIMLSKHKQKDITDKFILNTRKLYDLSDDSTPIGWGDILRRGTHRMINFHRQLESDKFRISTVYSNYFKHLKMNMENHYEYLSKSYQRSEGYLEFPNDHFQIIAPKPFQHGMNVELMDSVKRDVMIMFGAAFPNAVQTDAYYQVFKHNQSVKNNVIAFLKKKTGTDPRKLILNSEVLFEISHSVIQQRMRYLRYRSVRFKKEISKESSINNPCCSLLPVFYTMQDQDGIMILPLQVVLNEWNHPVMYLKDFNKESLKTLISYAGHPTSSTDDLELKTTLYKINKDQMKCLRTTIEGANDDLPFLLLKRSLIAPGWEQIAEGLDFGDGARFGSFQTVKEILTSPKNRQSSESSLSLSSRNERWGNNFYKSDSLNALKSFLNKLNKYGFLFKKNAKLFPIKTAALNLLPPKQKLKVPLGLKSYQQEGVQDILRLWHKGLSPILAFQMGLGKTITIAAALLEKSVKSESSCHLIVVPKSIAVQTARNMKNYLLTAQFNASRSYLELNEYENKILELIWNRLIIPSLKSGENLDKGLDLARRHPFVSERRKFLERSVNADILKQLNLADDLPAEIKPIDSKTIYALLNFNSEDIVNLDEQRRLPLARGNHQIYVATYPMITGRGWLADKLSYLKVDTVVFDEAQALHTAGNETNKKAKSVLTRLQQTNPHLRRLCSTGTPFENNYDELWELMAVCNTDIFTDNAKEAMNLFWQKAMIAYDKNSKPQDILFGFFHFESFRALIEKLVIVKNMNDRQVSAAWNGRVPKVVRLDIDASKTFSNKISQEAFEAIKKASDSAKKNEASLFSSNSKTERVLIHHKFENIKITSLESKCLISGFMRKITETPGWLNNHIHHFPSASALCHLPQFHQAIQHKKRVLIYTTLVAAGELTKAIIEKQFDEHQPEVLHYYGGLAASDRNAMVDRFKSGDGEKAKVLILTLQSGGVGLDIPEGDMIIFLTPGSYNPGIESQAEARIARVNTVGTKAIVKVSFDTFMHTHTLLMRQQKGIWLDYLLKKQSQDPLGTFLKVLRCEKAHIQFLDHKNAAQINLNTPCPIESAVLKEMATAKDTYIKILERLHPLTDTPDEAINLEDVASKKRKYPSPRGPLIANRNPKQGQKRPPEAKISPEKPQKIAKFPQIGYSDLIACPQAIPSFQRSQAFYFAVPGEGFAATVIAAKWAASKMVDESFRSFLGVLNMNRKAREAVKRGEIPDALKSDKHKKWAKELILIGREHTGAHVSSDGTIKIHIIGRDNNWYMVKYHKGTAPSAHIGCTKMPDGRKFFYVIVPNR